MKKQKIGIVTCSCATKELNCCSVVCLKDFNKRLGEFKRYPASTHLQLVGIVSCAGCPTLAYPEKILKKIDALAQFGAQTIHFTYCMLALCPFLQKYKKIIQQSYSDIELIEGTHDSLNTKPEFRRKVSLALSKHKPMADIIKGKFNNSQ